MTDNTVSDKTSTEFTRQRAIDARLDRTLFTLSAEQFEIFQKALDEPAAPTDKLKKLFSQT